MASIMNKLLIPTLFHLSFLVTSSAFAEGTKLMLASEYIEVLGYEQMFNHSLESCMDSTDKQSAESILEIDPNYFRGIDQHSKYWPEIQEIVKEYYRNSCNFIDTPKILDIFKSHYSKNLSVEELTQAIEFAKTPIGKKLTLLNIKANKDVNQAMNSNHTEIAEEANKIFLNKIEETAKKHEISRNEEK